MVSRAAGALRGDAVDYEFEGIPEKPGEEPVVLTRLEPPARAGLKLQHMMFAVGVCAIACWLLIVAEVWIFSLSLLLLSAVVIGALVILTRRGPARREMLLRTMAIAAEHSMPIAPAVLVLSDQFAPDHPPWLRAVSWVLFPVRMLRLWVRDRNSGFRRRVERLAGLLNEGVPLPEALGRVPGVISPDAEVLVRTGYATDTLARSLREAASLRGTRGDAWGATAARIAYLAWLLTVLQTISGFIMYFIVPKFEAIFRDFGVALPWVTRFTIGLSHSLVQYGFVFLPLFFLVQVALPLALLVSLLGPSAAWWDVPLISSLLRRRHSALVMRALSLAVAGRRPIPAVIDRLALEYPASWARRRLDRAGHDIQLGGDWADALAEHALIRPADAAVLHAAQRVGNLEWALRESADAVDRRLGYRLQFWLQMLFPVLLVGMGAVVALFAVAYFLPLVRLIETLAR